MQADRVEPGINLSHDIHHVIHQDGPLSRTRCGHGQHIPAIPIGKIVHDRSTLANLYGVVLVKRYLMPFGERTEIWLIHPSAAWCDLLVLVSQSEFGQGPKWAYCARGADAPFTQSLNKLYEPLLPLLETPTLHIGDDLLLEGVRIVVFESHDQRHFEACALGKRQATVDHGSTAFLFKVFVDGMVGFEA